jgi:hypothetical protein
MDKPMNYTMIHITRDCIQCGNPVTTRLGQYAQWYNNVPDFALFPYCDLCLDVADYGQITGDYDEWDDEYDEWEDHLAECGMYEDGLCTMAGSEWCDFECLIGRAYEQELEAQEAGGHLAELTAPLREVANILLEVCMAIGARVVRIYISLDDKGESDE